MSGEEMGMKGVPGRAQKKREEKRPPSPHIPFRPRPFQCNQLD
jgi:hypothetical protein